MNNLKLAIDIGNKKIKLLLGNNKTIVHHAILDTPEGSFEDNRLTNLDSLYEALNGYILRNNLKAKYVSFCIAGQDLLIRHIEIPLMEKKSMQEAVQWETNQYLPEGGKNYYIDYEILDREQSEVKKVFKVLTVAAPKEKVDLYAQLAEKLDMKLAAIDIYANCTSRFFINSLRELKDLKTFGIINVGNRSSSIIIMSKGMLIMEREIPFGIENLVREISKKLQIDMNEAFRYLSNNFSFDNDNHDEGINSRIQELFDNVCSSFQKVIQFSLNDSNERSLDKLFITGGGSEIRGARNYLGKYIGVPVDTIEAPDKLIGKFNYNRNWNLKLFINALGLLLRKES